jgi:3D (Asp-Asp-Asp) domain-containing protein
MEDDSFIHRKVDDVTDSEESPEPDFVETLGQALQKRHVARKNQRGGSYLNQKRSANHKSFGVDKEADPVADTQKKSQTKKVVQKKHKLFFGDEQVGGQTMNLGAAGTVVGRAAGAAVTVTHTKIQDEEEDNSAVQGAHKAELLAEQSMKSMERRRRIRNGSTRSRLREHSLDETEEVAEKLHDVQIAEKTAKHRAAQKAAIKRNYQKAAYQAAKESVVENKVVEIAANQMGKVKHLAQNLATKHKGIVVMIVSLLLLFSLLAVGLGSCTTMIQETATPIISTTYASTDENIYAVEDAYSALETALQQQINNMERTHPNYDEYDYQVDEISHNPYLLISYFTAKYGEFTYDQVKTELEEIFKEQYTLTTETVQETVTETRTVRVGESLGQVVTSGYCNCSICCGVWAGGATASGVYPTSNHTIAVDANDPLVPIGTKIVMNGVEYTVEDTGNFARYGVDFDVYYDSHSAASTHGHQTWEAYIADDNGSNSVEVTSTREITKLNVTLTNHGLGAILRSKLDSDQQKRYDLYNLTYGNRDYLFDVSTLPGDGGSGLNYSIPTEALSDAKFANMIQEAEKYLGYPYVWGGSSPNTSFDCSGYVSWVINNCGNGWNVGRLTASGLLNICTIVSTSEAQPGDLVFFQGTYDTTGASHVGIYVGDGMMIHCGSPIQYTSINTSYWQNHLYCFGRLP